MRTGGPRCALALLAVTALLAAGEPTIQRPDFVRVGEDFTLTLAGLSAGAEVSAEFGDGTTLPFAAATRLTHRYAQPGHWFVLVRVRGPDGEHSLPGVVTAHHPPTALPPSWSSAVAVSADSRRAWTVNPDAGTVACANLDALNVVWEVAVGAHPSTLAVVGDALWVACRDGACIDVLDAASGARRQRIALARATRPFAVCADPRGGHVYVSLEATGEVLALASDGTVSARRAIGPAPRHIACSADGNLLVPRWISPDEHGVIYRLRAPGLDQLPTTLLAPSADNDTEDRGAGVPNLLAGLAISPDGRSAWLTASKANIGRGTFRSGSAITFESTVRAMTARLDLPAASEDLVARLDYNDRDAPTAACFTPRGDYCLITFQGANLVQVVDACSREITGSLNCGRAPQGLALGADGRRLVVQNLLDRSLTVIDASALSSGRSRDLPVLGEIVTVAKEALSEAVLLGKRIFYNADDRRMNRDGYISCASCHPDGGLDGRTWDFTDRGEGLRNTIDLRGRRGTGHGPVHWTANFDEIQDFEHDMRGPFGGSGFLDDARFTTGTCNKTLGDRKAGLSPELDALAAYVTSLAAVPASPLRLADGGLTPSARRGRERFLALACQECHGGGDFTDSVSGKRHDVGSAGKGSGKRLGGALDGFDTPTLKGLWDTAPYLHDGSAATLSELFVRAPVGSRHRLPATLTAGDRQDLIDFLAQIDESEPAPAPLPVVPAQTP